MKTLNLIDPENSDIKYKISQFPDKQQDIIILGETSVSIEPAIYYDTLKKPIKIKSRFNSFKDLELIICATKALRRLGVKEIHLYIPYLLGARSDRQFVEGGTSYLVDVIAPIINSLEFESVTVMDVHSDVAAACIKNLKVIDNVELVKWATREICGVVSEKGPNSQYPFILISPDAGSLKKIYKVADAIDYKGDIITCSKHRDNNGKLSHTIVPIKYEESKDIIIIDDICDGGTTFMNISAALNDADHTGKKYLIVTHGIFSQGFKKLLQYFDGIYCTNSYSDLDSIIPFINISKNGNTFVKQLNIF